LSFFSLSLDANYAHRFVYVNVIIRLFEMGPVAAGGVAAF